MAVDEIILRKVDFPVYIRKTDRSATMIASVVATLTDDVGRLKSTISSIASRPGVDLGDFHSGSRKIPITIEGGNQVDLEATTRWVQEQPGVSFVDVVFVHFAASDRLPLNSQ